MRNRIACDAVRWRRYSCASRPSSRAARPVRGPGPARRSRWTRRCGARSTRNPTVQQAAAGILRAEALLQQTRALSLPSLGATLTTTRDRPGAGVRRRSRSCPRTQLNTRPGAGGAADRSRASGRSDNQADRPGHGVAARRRTTRGGRSRSPRPRRTWPSSALRQVVELNERARDNARDALRLRRAALRGRPRQPAERAARAAGGVDRRGARRGGEAGGEARAGGAGRARRRRRPGRRGADPEFPLSDEPAGPGRRRRRRPCVDAIATRADVRLVASRLSAAERVVNDSLARVPAVGDLVVHAAVAHAVRAVLAGAELELRRWSASIPIWEGGAAQGAAARAAGGPGHRPC